MKFKTIQSHFNIVLPKPRVITYPYSFKHQNNSPFVETKNSKGLLEEIKSSQKEESTTSDLKSKLFTSDANIDQEEQFVLFEVKL